MGWLVEYHEEFLREFEEEARAVRVAVAAHAELLAQFGPHLHRPYVDTLKGSVFPNMKELRVSVFDGEWRIAFAFDPERKAILLVGGDKSGGGENRFYEKLLRIADRRFTQHLARLKGKKQ